MLVRIAFGIVFLCGLLVFGAGVYWLVLRFHGERAQAHVDDCQVTGGMRDRRVHCTGVWQTGDLLEGGHVGVGEINGADTDDVGKTIDVFISGDDAYTLSLALPLVFLGLGAFVSGGMIWIFLILRDDKSKAVKN